MRSSIAILTSTALIGLFSPTASAAGPGSTPGAGAAVASPLFAELLAEDSYQDSGYEVTFAVTRDTHGAVLGEANVLEPVTGDEVEVWIEADTVFWAGIHEGQSTAGSVALADLDVGSGGAESIVCFTPVTAVVCLGVVAILFSGGGCAHFINCNPRDRSSNPPDPCASGFCEPPSSGDGGGGDATDDGESDGHGDGDE